jgi:Zn-dependent protease with chaperone function
MVSDSGRPSRVVLTGVSSRAYEHPSAQTALAAMQNIRGFDTLLRKVHGTIGEPLVRMRYLSSAVRVGPRQFRRLHDIKDEAIRVLDLPFEPEMYVQSMGAVNALTIGMDRPFIVVSTELLDVFDDEELLFVIGHEMGHALSGHSTYLTMARILANVGLSAFPIAGLAIGAVEAAMQDWSRKSELSSDRAGLLVSQDVDNAIRALMKLAAGAHASEMDTREFLKQAAEYELGATGARDRIYKFFTPSGTHPILVARASQLDQWVRGGSYARIVETRDYPRRTDDGNVTLRETIRIQRQATRQLKRLRGDDKELRRRGAEIPYSVVDGESDV